MNNLGQVKFDMFKSIEEQATPKETEYSSSQHSLKIQQEVKVLIQKEEFLKFLEEN